MNKPVTIRKMPPKLIGITKVAPKLVSVRLARPTQVVETAWNHIEW